MKQWVQWLMRWTATSALGAALIAGSPAAHAQTCEQGPVKVTFTELNTGRFPPGQPPATNPFVGRIVIENQSAARIDHWTFQFELGLGASLSSLRFNGKNGGQFAVANFTKDGDVYTIRDSPALVDFMEPGERVIFSVIGRYFTASPFLDLFPIRGEFDGGDVPIGRTRFLTESAPQVCFRAPAEGTRITGDFYDFLMLGTDSDDDGQGMTLITPELGTFELPFGFLAISFLRPLPPQPELRTYQMVARDQRGNIGYSLPLHLLFGEGCPGTLYQPGGNLAAGDIARNRDFLYECREPGWCNSTAASFYEPGVGSAWTLAWEPLVACEQDTPTPCAGPSYSAGAAYAQGQTVVNQGQSYRCDVSGWCSSPSALYYAPGTGLAWQSAWTLLGMCP